MATTHLRCHRIILNILPDLPLSVNWPLNYSQWMLCVWVCVHTQLMLSGLFPCDEPHSCHIWCHRVMSYSTLLSGGTWQRSSAADGLCVLSLRLLVNLHLSLLSSSLMRCCALCRRLLTADLWWCKCWFKFRYCSVWVGLLHTVLFSSTIFYLYLFYFHWEEQTAVFMLYVCL